MSKKNPNRGSSLDGFLNDEGVLETFQAAAIKKAIAWELSEEMAKQMKTSRSQLNKLLGRV